MTEYRTAMDRCGPDPALKERLKAQVLAAGEVQKTHKVYRPRSIARKVLLAAVLALALTASMGAALTQVPWDRIFTERFGPGAAATETAQQAFQEIDITSVCGDVTLTLRQAVGDNRTIYLILDYQLPQTADVEAIEAVMASEEAGTWFQVPHVEYYATGDITWKDIQGLTTEEARLLLSGSRFGDLSGSNAQQGFDPESRTLTCLLTLTVSGSRNLTDQPLTLLVEPPALYQDGAETLLADHPAIITFETTYLQRARTYELRDEEGNLRCTVTLSPFALSAESYSGGYTSLREFQQDVALVFEDGTKGIPEIALGWSGGGSRPGGSEVYSSLQFDCRFQEILDLDTVQAIRVGDDEVSIQDWVE